MSRPYRLKFKDACYLVTFNGVDGMGLFVGKTDALHFENLMDLIARKHQIILHAYALAENSAALVVETPMANLSIFVQSIQTAFARHIRQYYVHNGPIMKDRYRAKLIEKSSVLAPVCEWVHTFPVRESSRNLTPASQLKMLHSAPFSSYRYTAGRVEQGLSSPEELLRSYGSPAKNRAAKHTQACEKLLQEGGGDWNRQMKSSRVAIGSVAFVEEMEQKHVAILAGKRVKGFRQYGKKEQGISRNKVVDQVAAALGVDKQDFFVQQHASILRPVLSAFLYQNAAMTQKEIADFLGLGSAAAVSLQIKQLLVLRQEDPALDKKCRKLEKSIANS